MADLVWVSLLVGGTLLLVGFAASLLFERFRVPDFFMLLLLGVVLGHVPVEPFGPGLLTALGPVLPAFTALTLTFIMFEGGLTLSLRDAGKGTGVLVTHILGAMAVTMALTWLIATQVLGLSSTTGLVLAAAFSGPSATIVLSFAPHLRLSPNALNVILYEGVLGNIAAAVVVLFVIRTPGQEAGGALISFLSSTALGAAAAFLLGIGWRLSLRRLPQARFLYIATIAWAIVVYAVGDGIIGQSGAIAAFVLGIVLAYHRPSTAQAAAGPGPAEGLRAFQAEITFVMRTFFFVYLGLTMTFDRFSVGALFGAVLLTAGFVVARAPTTFLVRRAIHLTGRETRVLLGTVGRGLTDVVLVLLAVESGVLPAVEADFLVGMLPLIILVAAITCAGLLAWAERGSGVAPAGPVDLYRM